MNRNSLQWALIVVLAALSAYLLFTGHRTGTGADAHPVAFDLEASHVPLVVGGQLANRCFTAGTLCFVKIRYLSNSPTPECVPGTTSDCRAGQTTRSLPDCSGSHEQLCLTFNTSTAAEDQDAAGVHPAMTSTALVNGEVRIVFSTSPLPGS